MKFKAVVDMIAFESHPPVEVAIGRFIALAEHANVPGVLVGFRILLPTFWLLQFRMARHDLMKWSRSWFRVIRNKTDAKLVPSGFKCTDEEEKFT